jgi:hypothetical protein
VERKTQATLLAAVVLLLLAVALYGPYGPFKQQASAGDALPPAAGTAAQAVGPPPHPRFESTGRFAKWVDPKTGLNVNNDMWNCPHPACGRQSVWANSSADWGVVSTMANGNTAVLTYPAVQDLFSAGNPPAPLANARELLSTFTESMPTTPGTIGEAAYDIWLNNWNTEIMIWVDNQHQQFNRLPVATVIFNGQRFAVYVTRGVSDGYPRGPFFFVLQQNETSGTVDVLAAIRWLEGAGYLSASRTGINAVDFGWEICSTGGVAENFSVSRYTLAVKGIQLPAAHCAGNSLAMRSRTADPPGRIRAANNTNWVPIYHWTVEPRPPFAVQRIATTVTNCGTWKVTAPTTEPPCATWITPTSKLLYPAIPSKSAV